MALSRALTGPLPSAAVCSMSPSTPLTFTLASESMPDPRLSMKILNASTLNLSTRSPRSLLTRSSKLASAPSNSYPLDSISLMRRVISGLSLPASSPSSFSFSDMLALPAMSETRILLEFPTVSGPTCS